MVWSVACLYLKLYHKFATAQKSHPLPYFAPIRWKAPSVLWKVPRGTLILVVNATTQEKSAGCCIDLLQTKKSPLWVCGQNRISDKKHEKSESQFYQILIGGQPCAISLIFFASRVASSTVRIINQAPRHFARNAI